MFKKILLAAALLTMVGSAMAVDVTVEAPNNDIHATVYSESQAGSKWAAKVTATTAMPVEDSYNINFHGVLQFWDYKYNTYNVLGGLSFDQKAGNVSFVCEPDAYATPVNATVTIDGDDLVTCNGTNSTTGTTHYTSSSKIVISVTK